MNRQEFIEYLRQQADLIGELASSLEESGTGGIEVLGIRLEPLAEWLNGGSLDE